MSQLPQKPWRSAPAGVSLTVRASPKSSREGVDGIAQTTHGPALSVRVRAVAEKGEANRAIERAVAEWLGVAKGSVAVAAGGKSRLKTVAIAGDRDALAALIETRMAQLS